MNVVSYIVLVLCVLAAIAVAWWVITKLSLPPPVMTVVYVVCGILAIMFLLSLASGGLPAFHLGHH